MAVWRMVALLGYTIYLKAFYLATLRGTTMHENPGYFHTANAFYWSQNWALQANALVLN